MTQPTIKEKIEKLITQAENHPYEMDYNSLFRIFARLICEEMRDFQCFSGHCAPILEEKMQKILKALE